MGQEDYQVEMLSTLDRYLFTMEPNCQLEMAGAVCAVPFTMTLINPLVLILTKMYSFASLVKSREALTRLLWKRSI